MIFILERKLMLSGEIPNVKVNIFYMGAGYILYREYTKWHDAYSLSSDSLLLRHCALPDES